MDNKTQETLLDMVKMMGSILIPWRDNHSSSEEYRKGWNDCVKESKRVRDKMIKDLLKTDKNNP